MKKYILTDFNKDRWVGTIPTTIESALERMEGKNTIYGELGHNNGFDEYGHFDRARMLVQLSNVTHQITDVKYKGGLIEGNVEFLPTNHGKIAKELMERGLCEFGIRGISYEHEKDGLHITEIVEIITWDVIPKIK